MSRYDSTRKSMLDTLQELEAANKNRLQHSCVLVSQVDPRIDSAYAKIASRYETLFIKLQKRYQCEPPTGLLLLYSNFAFHFIEAHHTLLMHIIRDLQSCTSPSSDALFMNSIIAQYLSNIKFPLLPVWKSVIIDIPPSSEEPYQTTDSLDVVVGSVARSFYKLVSMYHKFPKSEAMRFLDKIHERIDLIVSREKLEYLLKQKELLRPDQFVKIVEQRNTTPLQSDVAWPVPTRLFHV